MTIEELKKRKIELGYTNQRLAEKSGVPLSTVQKVLSGLTKAPRKETLNALRKALYESPAYPTAETHPTPDSTVAETALSYGASGYTLADYLALPEEKRAELIDGVFYDMAAPTTLHQFLCGKILFCFQNYVHSNHGSCLPLISPVDVQLDCDEKTIVQPDVLIVCDRSKFQDGHIFGAPDLVVEVLSPSTRRKDLTLKYAKYTAAGVREYWIVDPDSQRLMVYDLEHDPIFPTLYTFSDSVSVRIWDGRCKVDFSVIRNQLDFLL